MSPYPSLNSFSFLFKGVWSGDAIRVKFSTLKVWQIHWPQFTVNWEYFASENKRIVSGFLFYFSILVPYFYLASFIYGIILVSLSNPSFCEVCIREVLYCLRFPLPLKNIRRKLFFSGKVKIFFLFISFAFKGKICKTVTVNAFL